MILGYVGNRWEKHIVSSLENALRKWADSVPAHRTISLCKCTRGFTDA